MKQGCSTILIAFLLTFAVSGALQTIPASSANEKDATLSAGRSPARVIPEPERVGASEAYGKLPLSFEANRGQFDSQVKFVSRLPGQTLFLTSTEAVLVSKTWAPSGRDPSIPAPLAAATPKLREPATTAVLRMRFSGGNPTPQMIGAEELPGKANYFIGNDPTKWRTGVPTYAKVRYEQIYPGIDLVYRGNQRRLEYDFIVAPGADPAQIALRFEGADRMEVDAQGDLVVHTAAGPIRHRKPLIYQEVAAVRKEIPGGYVLTGTHEVGFRVGAYAASLPLIIDPILIYSTFLGGSNGNFGSGLAVDASGHAYVTGQTAAANFPTTPGAFDSSYGAGADAFVTKLDVTGSNLVYSTYLGGSGSDGGSGIAVDASGSAYVTGWTNSSNFPTTPGAFDTSFGGGLDAFATKLDATGSNLVYSTYLGGSGDDAASGIAVDASGSAYVTGSTNSSNFPTTPGAFDGSLGGLSDAFVTKLDATGSNLLYSTYLGGSDGDQSSGIAVDASGSAYVTGWTSSRNFPTTPGAFDTHGGGLSDAFVTKLNATGSNFVYSTYLGGSENDFGMGIAVDASGSAYVTGSTQSANNFPTTPGAFDTHGHGHNGISFDAFVTKLDATGSNLVYSTYLGGSGDDHGLGIAVDASGSAYVTGSTRSPNFPTTPGAFDRSFSFTGTHDAFVAKVLFLTGYEIVRNRVLLLPSSVAYVSAICPSGKKVLGGGFDIETPDFVKLFLSEPIDDQSTYSDHMWSVFAQNSDPNNSRQVTVSAICASAALLVNHEIVTNQLFLPPSSTMDVSVNCSFGHVLLGGGFSIETPDDIKVFSAQPFQASSQNWRVRAQNTDPNNARQVTASAVCAAPSFLPGYLAVSHQLLVPPSGAANVTQMCPSGYKVLGGGFGIATPAFVKLFSTEPSDGHSNFSDHDWNILVQNTDPSNARSAEVTAICARL